MPKTIDNIIYSDDLKIVVGVESQQITTAVIKEGVTTIGKGAFWYYCKKLKSVTIPEGVTIIEDGAFKWCSKLQSVTIPSSVTTIGESAFAGCPKLQSVVIPEGVTTIGERTFSECTNLQNVVIPEGVTTIGEWAFFGCTNLQSVTIPSSVTTIGELAFYGCKNLQKIEIADLSAWIEFDDKPLLNENTKLYLNGEVVDFTNFVIPEGTKKIGESTFSGCTNLQNVVIPDSVTTIGRYAFNGCANLQNVKIPDSVTEIGNAVFRRCKIENYEHKLFKIKNSCFLSSDEKTVLYCTNASQEEIAIPEGVTTIEGYAFYECTNLQNVDIPSSVTTIGYEAFYGCTNLQNVTIPDSVTVLGDKAFKDCENLKEVHLGGNIEELTGQIFDGCPNVELYAPEKSLTAKAIKKNAKLKKLYKNAEYELKQAKDAKITEIKAAGTQGLLRAYSEGIGREQKVEQIWKNIEVTILTNELDSENNSKYAKITVPEKTAQKKLSEIKTALDEVRSEGINVTVEKLLETLKKNVESFEWEIYNEKDDRTIYLVKILDAERNYDYSSQWDSVYDEFKNIIISKKVKKIKDFAFSNCPNLQNIVIPEGVTSIGESAFYDCTNLQSVVIPKGVTTIGGFAFCGCKNLQNVIIPSSVTLFLIRVYRHKVCMFLPNNAFLGCENLTVTFDGTKEEWEKIDGVKDCKAKNVKFNK